MNGNAIKMKTGDFVLLSPKDSHFFAGQSEDAFLFSLSVSVEKFNRILSAAETVPLYGEVCKITDKNILGDMTTLPVVMPERRKVLINTILFMLVASNPENEDRQGSGIPIFLLNAVEKFRLPENVGGGVKGLSRLAGYSTMHLGRLIKKYYGVTASELIRDIRMLSATEYLENSSLPIESVAESVGFSSVGQFYAVFKKKFGCTPSEYRKTRVSSPYLSA